MKIIHRNFIYIVLDLSVPELIFESSENVYRLPIINLMLICVGKLVKGNPHFLNLDTIMKKHQTSLVLVYLFDKQLS